MTIPYQEKTGYGYDERLENSLPLFRKKLYEVLLKVIYQWFMIVMTGGDPRPECIVQKSKYRVKMVWKYVNLLHYTQT